MDIILKDVKHWEEKLPNVYDEDVCEKCIYNTI